MSENGWGKRIFLGITGEKQSDWESKLKDISSLGLTEAALFLEKFNQSQRKKIYRTLLGSSLKNIPLCHIRNDMEVEELVFMEAKFKTKYFTVHENSFSFLDKWPGFEKKIYLEMDYNDAVSNKVSISRIGGFCVDLSHFKAAQTKWSKEFRYTYFKKGKANFYCNHLNGYSKKENRDIHNIKSLKEFEYLKTLPEFIFGKVIGLEVENGILEQIEFKEYLVRILKDVF
jgi:hypothetical protein